MWIPKKSLHFLSLISERSFVSNSSSLRSMHSFMAYLRRPRSASSCFSSLFIYQPGLSAWGKPVTKALKRVPGFSNKIVTDLARLLAKNYEKLRFPNLTSYKSPPKKDSISTSPVQSCNYFMSYSLSGFFWTSSDFSLLTILSHET